MRTTHSPLKSKAPVPPAPFVSACVVTHYTDHPYHAKRMEVVETCLRTMVDGMTGADYEVLIWDNGSTPEFRDMLRKFAPAVLVESVNIGAHNARRNLAEIARGEILMQTDDDVLFHPEWLSLQLELLGVFPNVGIVSGSPHRPAFTWGQTPPPEGVKVKHGNFFPEQWIRDACASVGSDFNSFMWTFKNVQDTLLECQDEGGQTVRAWGHAHHMQFLGRREIVKPFLKPNPYMLGDGRVFNQDIMTAGLLQLTTYQRTAIHIGNYLDPRLREIMVEWKV